MDRKLTILLADDDENYALILQGAMKTIGWTNPTRSLPNGMEVIKYLGGDGDYANREVYPFPSVMFLDIKMPGASGFDVLRWVREHPQCTVTPTIMLSSSDDERDVQLAYQLGANGYFLKPSKISDLKTMLQAAYQFWSCCAKPKVSGAGCGRR